MIKLHGVQDVLEDLFDNLHRKLSGCSSDCPTAQKLTEDDSSWKCKKFTSDSDSGFCYNKNALPGRIIESGFNGFGSGYNELFDATENDKKGWMCEFRDAGTAVCGNDVFRRNSAELRFTSMMDNYERRKHGAGIRERIDHNRYLIRGNDVSNDPLEDVPLRNLIKTGNENVMKDNRKVIKHNRKVIKHNSGLIQDMIENVETSLPSLIEDNSRVIQGKIDNVGTYLSSIKREIENVETSLSSLFGEQSGSAEAVSETSLSSPLPEATAVPFQSRPPPEVPAVSLQPHTSACDEGFFFSENQNKCVKSESEIAEVFLRPDAAARASAQPPAAAEFFRRRRVTQSAADEFVNHPDYSIIKKCGQRNDIGIRNLTELKSAYEDSSHAIHDCIEIARYT